MPRLDSTATTLIVAAAMASAVGYGATEWANARKQEHLKVATAKEAPAAPKQPTWAASAPGRVEPRSGTFHLSSRAPGKVAEVLVRSGDRVQAGDPLIRIDDEEARARLQAALADVEVRRRDRDAETVGRPALDRRNAEDAVAAAERALHAARTEFDRVFAANRSRPAAEEVSRARSAVAAAREKLDQERANLTRVLALPGMPAPTRLEAGLAAARTDVTLAELAIEHSRIRAPVDGTVLQTNVKVGEIIAPSADAPALTLGDTSALRVKGEIQERDIAKVRVGQRVTVQSNAFPGQSYGGSVASIAPVLGLPRLGSGSGPRKPTDMEVLEVTIDLDGQPPLLPGMRVDVFFAPDATVQSSQTAPVR